MPIRFAGTHEKLRRAEVLIGQLAKAIEEFEANRPYQAVPDLDEETGEFRYLIMDAPQAPLRWAVISGEIVHDLRSALDHLVYEIGAKRTDDAVLLSRLQFPIAVSRESYVQHGLPRIGLLSDEDQHAIEACQPFHDAFPEVHELAVLQRLSNADKHRTLHLVQRVLVHNSLTERDIPRGFVVESLTVSHSTGGGEAVAEGVVRRVDPNAMFDIEAFLFTEVQLPDALPYGGDAPPLMDTLRSLLIYLRDAVLPRFG